MARRVENRFSFFADDFSVGYVDFFGISKHFRQEVSFSKENIFFGCDYQSSSEVGSKIGGHFCGRFFGQKRGTFLPGPPQFRRSKIFENILLLFLIRRFKVPLCFPPVTAPVRNVDFWDFKKRSETSFLNLFCFKKNVKKIPTPKNYNN